METTQTKTEVSFLLLGLVFLALAFLFFFFHFFTFETSLPKKVSYLSSASQDALVLPESLPGATRMALGYKINLNQANQADLEALPDIGPAMAARIVKRRQELGRFASFEELMSVKGIKEKKLARIKNFVELR